MRANLLHFVFFYVILGIYTKAYMKGVACGIKTAKY